MTQQHLNAIALILLVWAAVIFIGRTSNARTRRLRRLVFDNSAETQKEKS